MESICVMPVEEFKTSRLKNDFFDVKTLSSVEDVATLLEVFENAMQECSIDDIYGVVGNSAGYYIFLSGGSGFDLYGFINEVYKHTSRVSCVNARLMYPMSKSRGMFMYEEEISPTSREPLTGSDTDDGEDDVPTGFFSEDFHFVRERTGERVKFDEDGVMVGRSSARSDYIITGNGSLSRSHCKFFVRDGSAYIHDDNSSNGTYLNGRRLSMGETVPVGRGDKVVLAGETFIIE